MLRLWMILLGGIAAAALCWLAGQPHGLPAHSSSRELPTPPEEPESAPLPPCCGAPPERFIHDPHILDSPEARTIILVRVIGWS
jgi:hypothetical protein